MNIGILNEQEKEYVAYAFDLMKMSIMGIIVAIICGIVLDVTRFSVLFLLCFIPLRKYAGGYHAKTHKKCAVISLILLLATDILFKYGIYKTNICDVLVLILCGYIWYKAPMDTCNKRLLENEKKVFRKKACWILLCIQLIWIVSKIYHMELLYGASSIAIICTGIILLLQSILDFTIKHQLQKG